MTISSTTNTVSYTGNGSTTAFAVNYVFFGTGTSAEIQVVEVVIATGVETVKSNGSDFTVSGGNGATGTVTAAVAPASTVKWVINRATTQTQETDYVENDPFPAESHEEALDRLTAVDQEQQRALDRTAQLPDGYTGSFDPTLPTTITGSTVLAFNSGATAFEIGPTTAAISGAASSATAAASSATAAASSATAAASSATAAAASETATNADVATINGYLTGQWTGANGSVSAPYFSFSADPNSGFYRIGADNLGLTLGGTKRVDFGTATTAFSNEVTATGFTGTLDGVLGGGTPAAVTGTTLKANTSLQLATGATVTGILDEDAMGTNSATQLATQQSIKAYVDGGRREVLTGNRTYYVRTGGSDSNTGLADDDATAFATKQHAFDLVQETIDIAGHVVTIQLQQTTHSDSCTLIGRLTGALGPQSFVFNGGGNPAVFKTTTSAANAAIYQGQDGAEFTVQGQQLSSTHSGGIAILSNNSTIALGNNYYDDCGRAFIDAAGPNAVIEMVPSITAFTMIGDTTNAIIAEAHAQIQLQGVTFTVSPAITVSSFFLNANQEALVDVTGASNAGAAITGGKYKSSSNALVVLGSYSPAGSTAGVIASGGRVIDASGDDVAVDTVQPCFLVNNTSEDTNATGAGTVATVGFDAEIFDNGSNVSTTTFTAPITAKYFLQAQIRISGVTTAAYSAAAKFVTSNRTTNHYQGGAPDLGSTSTFNISGVFDMDASDTASVTIAVAGESSDVVDIVGAAVGAPATFFSGHIVS